MCVSVSSGGNISLNAVQGIAYKQASIMEILNTKSESTSQTIIFDM